MSIKDRHANATEDEKQEQEKKFKEVGEAYAVLSDSKKRTRYVKYVCYYVTSNWHV